MADNNWKSTLSLLKLPQARILYLIYYLFGAGELDYLQKYRLKQLVVLEEKIIYEAYNTYERTKSINKLLIDFRKILSDKEIISKYEYLTIIQENNNGDVAEENNNNENNNKNTSSNDVKINKNISQETFVIKTFLQNAVAKVDNNLN